MHTALPLGPTERRLNPEGAILLTRRRRLAMSTTIDRTELLGHGVPAGSSRVTLRRILLACGVLYALLYAVVNDVIAATLYEGYSRLDQAVSELSATGAPTTAFLTAILPISTTLLMAFGIGVWKSAHGKRALRVTGALLVAHSVTHPLWLFYPMTSREEIVKGAALPPNDIGHIVLTVTVIALLVSEIGFAAAAFGKRFRLYSLATVVSVLAFGAWTGMLAPGVAAGEPTPWMGLVERMSIWPWLLWLVVLAIILWPVRSTLTQATSETADP